MHLGVFDDRRLILWTLPCCWVGISNGLIHYIKYETFVSIMSRLLFVILSLTGENPESALIGDKTRDANKGK